MANVFNFIAAKFLGDNTETSMGGQASLKAPDYMVGWWPAHAMGWR
jgi:hypothetical protein